MVRRRVITTVASLAVLALAVSACSSSSSAPTESPSGSSSAAPSGPGVPTSLIGMQVEGVEGEAWPSAPFGALRLWDNGTAWSQIELSKGEFKWDNLEGALANAESKGMTDILMVLGTTPAWAVKKGDVASGSADYPQPGAASAPADMADWDNWVTAVVTRYKGRISSYEIWNEANLKNFYNGTPAQLADMTARAYAIIKAADPKALVVAASPALRLSGRFDAFYPKYLAALAAADWPIDALTLHAYPAADGSPKVRGELINVFKAALTAAGAPTDMPIWDTELNYGLAGPGDIPKVDITGPAAAGWIVRTYIDNLRFGIERAYWYIWTQKPYALLGIQAYPGSDGEQGFFALDNWVIGSTFEGCTDSAGAVTCNFSRDGQKSVVAWADAGEIAYTAPSGSQLVCDPLANCQEVAEGSAIMLTEVPIRVYLQG